MNCDNTPHIIIAEDELTFGKALAESLQARGIKTTGIAANGNEVIELLKHQLVDLVLMDIRMPIMNGIETTEFIAKNYPSVKVLMLSSYTKDAYVQQAIEVGAQGYLLKNSQLDEIVLAVKTIMQGGNYFSPNVYNELAKKIRGSKPENIIKLSNCEKIILKLLSDGFTTDEISIRLSVSVHTVKNYRKNMLIKFNAKNSTHLVSIAFKKGYFDNLNVAHGI